MISSITVFSLVFIVVTLYALEHVRRRRMPPGPPADPLIGNLRVLPTTNEGVVFHEWAKKYGDVVYVHALGRSIVILDSVTAATDLLEKRSSIYSDRPNFTVFWLMGYFPDLPLLPYGKRFQKHRRMLHSDFTPEAILSWRDMQTKNARQLTRSILKSNEDYDRTIGWFTTALVIKLAYGVDIESEEDELVKVAENSQFLLNNSGAPGGTFVDLFPILKHLPSWFPGTYYANFARKGSWVIKTMYDLPYSMAERLIADGDETHSVVGAQIRKLQKQEAVTQEEIDDAKGAGVAIFSAGAETTWSSLVVFLWAMIEHPDIQKKVQAEIDTVLRDHDRLPEFSDWESLPYFEGVVQEVIRWYPVVPLGVPHRCMEDDVYRGMFIPKGTLMIANARGMSLDETVYAEPTKFNPSRFLPKPEGNGEPFFTSAFGFGRRICPGRHIALSSLWIVMATILATSDIGRALDDEGNEIYFEPEFMYGITSRPKTFPCRITSRSKDAKQMLERSGS
ncbi:hypothetical protein HGRIS_000973 [Hohenbuehelia grisea]|uniref:Cytochrome P450 n=1 Tax=Hohenbuehelia grisea TaxID=104357 RepID=A0ABR3IQC7_9AGAR